VSFVRHHHDEAHGGNVTGQNEFSSQPECLAQTSEAKRVHLRAVAYRTLGILFPPAPFRRKKEA
jgi:hypothetical protein